MATLNVNLEHITMPRAENILQMKAKTNKVLQTKIPILRNLILHKYKCETTVNFTDTSDIIRIKCMGLFMCHQCSVTLFFMIFPRIIFVRSNMLHLDFEKSINRMSQQIISESIILQQYEFRYLDHYLFVKNLWLLEATRFATSLPLFCRHVSSQTQQKIHPHEL